MWQKRYDDLVKHMIDVDLLPNASQYGIAVAAVNDLRHKSLISMPSGQGKSRVIAAIIAIRGYKFS